MKNLKNNASLNNKIGILIFKPVRMKLCQSKQADLLFSASLHCVATWTIGIACNIFLNEGCILPSFKKAARYR